jgi:hypothetical protein
MPTATEFPEAVSPPPATERRAFVRFRCFGPCAVRLVGAGNGEVLGMTYDLSRNGIGFALLDQLPDGARIIVERVGQDNARPLYATVVRSTQLANAWFHGCQLFTTLSEEELSYWLK